MPNKVQNASGVMQPLAFAQTVGGNQSMKLKFLEICLVLLLLYSCQGDNEKHSPWTVLSLLNQLETKIIVVNNLEVEQAISIKYFNKTTRATLDKTINLNNGQVDTISISLGAFMKQEQMIKTILSIMKATN